MTYDAGSSIEIWHHNLNRSDYNGGSRFSSVTYPGLVIDTTDANPSAFNVFVGKSFSQSMVELTEDTLSSSSSIKTAETAYRTANTDVAQKLVDLETREKLLTSRYTTRLEIWNSLCLSSIARKHYLRILWKLGRNKNRFKVRIFLFFD